MSKLEKLCGKVKEIVFDNGGIKKKLQPQILILIGAMGIF
jgi:hypothetical protein